MDKEKDNLIKIKRNPGKPKAFVDDDDFVLSFIDYIGNIFDNDFEEVPSYMGFAKYKGIGKRTVFRYLENNPKIKDRIGELFADCLSVGSIKGIYKGNMPIFALKNRSGWTDRKETTNITKDNNVATEKEAKEKLKEIASRLTKEA